MIEVADFLVLSVRGEVYWIRSLVPMLKKSHSRAR
jgi:hypothetical protein